jgi:hypothetical protein
MKTKIGLILTLIFTNFLLAQSSDPQDQNAKDGEYIIIGWNDLGMHCANKDFSKICVLPPYNNMKAEIIKVGNETNSPELITTGYTVTYEVPGNTYSVGKTNFWSYEDLLFGVTLPDNIGLTGVGLTGNMGIIDNNFHVEGIPVTPFTDANLITEDPYQLALLKAYDGQNNLLASTQPVIPVSNEISCVSSGCHGSEMGILYEHEEEGGFDPNNTPILCAECHSSNALGTPGTPGLASLSQVIHQKHGGETNDCYKCHPGPNTQCFRDVMHSAGMICQDCHGSVSNVGNSIANGREPWLEEPRCGATECHGSNYSEEPGKLFRQSKGHGGMYCSACHGSPHAILPSSNERDNVQNIALQGYQGALSKCSVCHGVNPSGAGPHGIYASIIEVLGNISSKTTGFESIFPNPSIGKTYLIFNVSEPSKVDLDIFSLNGQKVISLVKQRMNVGQYKVEFNASEYNPGIYFAMISSKSGTDKEKLIISR